MILRSLRQVGLKGSGFRRGGLRRAIANAMVPCWAMALLVACASTSPSSSESEEADAGSEDVVARMAAARWDLLLKGRLAEAYDEYVSPASKQVTSKNAYVGGMRPGSWRGYGVSKVSCPTADICNVVVDVNYAYRPKAGGVIENVRPVDEIWRRLDGRWWFVIGK